MQLLFSCEHGGNDIPAEFRSLFRDSAVLKSHRGWDPGALQLARQLAAHFDAPLHQATVSRLLVELNRSPHHPRLFSEYSRQLDGATRNAILNSYYLPYRQAVETDIRQLLAKGRTVLHISVHSFTPRLDDELRNADIGLLYDPRRVPEKDFCGNWKSCFDALTPRLRVRRNYPYTGVQDGFITALRKLFGPAQYIGVELETNQQFVLAGGRRWASFRDTVETALHNAIEAAGS